MSHEATLVATIAVGLAFALVGGLIAVRLRLPPLVGYLLAGIAVGPFTPGFVGDVHLAPQLAEIGVILLMFGVGMHFSLRDLLAVRAIAVPGAIAQMALATALGVLIALAAGWSFGAGLVFGLALSVASTVVLLRELSARGALTSSDGQIAVGWLIVEDVAMVVALVLLPALAAPLGGQAPGASQGATLGNLWLDLGWTLGRVALFVALMLLVGARLLPRLLQWVERTGSRELFTLAVVALALGIAFGSAELFGVSFALGAFFAGIVIGESDSSHRAATELQPLQDIFSILFFVAVGMLFDPSILLRQPLQVLFVVLLIVIGKALIAIGLVLGLRRPLSTALYVGASLAQIGEFSFILAELGVALGLLPPEGQQLILAGALFSITLNPFVMTFATRLQPRLAAPVSVRAEE
jgi:CPA2 family monovalent cation:H+ antiporter-2